MPLLTHRFDTALVYAHEAHRNHLRKGTDIPYMSHLMGVASLVLEYGGIEDQAIAGLLHDAVEDAGGQTRLDDIRRVFGDEVATIVADCTDSWIEPKPEWRVRKTSYIAGMARAPLWKTRCSRTPTKSHIMQAAFLWRQKKQSC